MVLGCTWDVHGLDISSSDAEGAPGNSLSILKHRNGTMKKSLLNFSQFGIQSNLIDAALMQGELVGCFHWRVKNTKEKLGLYVRHAFPLALVLMQGKVISLNAGAAHCYLFRGINKPTDAFPPPPASVRLPFWLGGTPGARLKGVSVRLSFMPSRAPSSHSPVEREMETGN